MSDLFDYIQTEPVRGRDSRNDYTNPIASPNDPISSHLAASEVTVSGRRARQCQEVLAAVKKWPGRTSAELAQLAGLDRHLVARRLPDLEHRLLIRKGPMRECLVSGRKAVTWVAMNG